MSIALQNLTKFLRNLLFPEARCLWLTRKSDSGFFFAVCTRIIPFSAMPPPETHFIVRRKFLLTLTSISHD